LEISSYNEVHRRDEMRKNREEATYTYAMGFFKYKETVEEAGVIR
jgi:hypothetical protein